MPELEFHQFEVPGFSWRTETSAAVKFEDDESEDKCKKPDVLSEDVLPEDVFETSAAVKFKDDESAGKCKKPDVLSEDVLPEDVFETSAAVKVKFKDTESAGKCKKPDVLSEDVLSEDVFETSAAVKFEGDGTQDKHENPDVLLEDLFEELEADYVTNEEEGNVKKLPTSFITRASGIDKTEDEIFIVGAEEGSINRISINSLTGASRSARAEAESLFEAEGNIKKPTSLVNKASKTDQIRSNNSQSTQSGTIDLTILKIQNLMRSKMMTCNQSIMR